MQGGGESRSEMVFALLASSSAFLPTSPPCVRVQSPTCQRHSAPFAAEGTQTVGNRRPDVFGAMTPDERAAFLSELEHDCSAAGVSLDDLERFNGLLETMVEDAPPWQVLSTGQVWQRIIEHST